MDTFETYWKIWWRLRGGGGAGQHIHLKEEQITYYYSIVRDQRAS